MKLADETVQNAAELLGECVELRLLNSILDNDVSITFKLLQLFLGQREAWFGRRGH